MDFTLSISTVMHGSIARLLSFGSVTQIKESNAGKKDGETKGQEEKAWQKMGENKAITTTIIVFAGAYVAS